MPSIKRDRPPWIVRPEQPPCGPGVIWHAIIRHLGMLADFALGMQHHFPGSCQGKVTQLAEGKLLLNFNISGTHSWRWIPEEGSSIQLLYAMLLQPENQCLATTLSH